MLVKKRYEKRVIREHWWLGNLSNLSNTIHYSHFFFFFFFHQSLSQERENKKNIAEFLLSDNIFSELNYEKREKKNY